MAAAATFQTFRRQINSTVWTEFFRVSSARCVPKFSGVLIFGFVFLFLLMLLLVFLMLLLLSVAVAGPSMSAGKRQKAIKGIKNA